MVELQHSRKAFTIIELLITLSLIAILTAIGISNYNRTLQRSREADTKGNLGKIRSALSLYYSNLEGMYPQDDLTCIRNDSRYLAMVPRANTEPYHRPSTEVTAEGTPSDTGNWSYNNLNVSTGTAWGAVHVGCSHQDSHGVVWSTY